MTKFFTVLFAVFFFFCFKQNVFCQNNKLAKYPGFIGLYENTNGTVYGGGGIPDGELLQRAFNFGENGIICQDEYLGYTFQANLDSNCTGWDVDKVFGILRPPSEDGKVNQPGDTVLYKPYASLPGMIQGAHRFSELSKNYPQITGVIIDDFFSNGGYPKNITLQDVINIKDALLGKKVDSNGNVDHNSKATTPNLKLYICIYSDFEHQLDINDPALKKVIDGLNLWIWRQNEHYKLFNSYFDKLKRNYPDKDIMLGMYLKNSDDGDISPVSINYVMKRAINLYDKGKVSGFFLFSGPFLTREYITKARWDSLEIPQLLNKYYYQYLGKGTGKVIDEATGQPISNALVTIQRIENGIPEVVAGKFTNSSGQYDFGGWAGKENAVNYQINVEKASYKPQTINVTLQAQTNLLMPYIKLTAIKQ